MFTSVIQDFGTVPIPQGRVPSTVNAAQEGSLNT